MTDYIKVILKSGKDQSLKRFHPWIFSGAIKKIKGEPTEGQLVAVFSNQDEFLGLGHYQIGSIAVRIISFQEETIDENFWQLKIKNAINYRKDIGILNLPDTNVFRLIHAEGDNLPGLIVDYYNGVVVMQMHSIAMHQNRDIIASAIKEALGEKVKSIYNKSTSTLPHQAQIDDKEGFLFGDQHIVEVEEYGSKYIIDVIEGQKTGFFIDQRENRKLVADNANGKKILNMFGYTGGFSIAALHAGAREVVTVDVSKKAIDLTEKNIQLNYPNGTNHIGVASDAFKYMDKMDNDFDIVILDPPAFAKHQNVLHNALQGYKRLNQVALEKIKPGSLLLTFSCSQVVSKENFRKSVFAASANARREVKILKELSQPADHPVNIYHPESEYLKGLMLYVR